MDKHTAAIAAEEFSRNCELLLSQTQATREPLVITVEGKPTFVLQDAANYSALLDEVEHLKTLAAIHRGLEAMRQGNSLPAEQAFDSIEAKHPRLTPRELPG